jgi:hypothetical protein
MKLRIFMTLISGLRLSYCLRTRQSRSPAATSELQILVAWSCEANGPTARRNLVLPPTVAGLIADGRVPMIPACFAFSRPNSAVASSCDLNEASWTKYPLPPLAT